MVNSDPPSPILRLRMRVTGPCPNVGPLLIDSEQLDQIRVLVTQDHFYYSSKGFNIAVNSSNNINIDKFPSLPCDDENYDTETGIDPVDSSCRELLTEWEYKIIDHFGLSREIVAISFYYLDRFIAKCKCDRKAYKLAAMTSLFIATKIYNSRQLTIATLATLSRGEFEISHIAQMELIILKTLEWKVNPPTVQSFIHIWDGLLPKGASSRKINQRATFFAEALIFDTILVSEQRALIAIAALFNAMEEGADRFSSVEEKCSFLATIESTYGVRYLGDEINSVRNRLWYIYSKTSQCKEDYTIVFDANDHEPLENKNKFAANGGISAELSQSPTSVHLAHLTQ